MSKRVEIRSLTGLRGAAALFVTTYHAFYWMISNQENNSLGIVFLRHGYLSVDLFFVLSGYVMALNYAPLFAAGFRLDAFADFLGRRIGRVYPAYIVVTIYVAICNIPSTSWRELETGLHFGTNVLMVQSWGFSDSIVGPGWSVSTELAAYLCFPLLVGAVLQRGPRWTWAGAATATAVLLFVATRSSATLHQAAEGAVRHGPLDIYGTGTAFLLLRCLSGFTLGLIAFGLGQHSVVKNIAGRRFAGDIVMAGVFMLMLVSGSDVALVLMFVPLILALVEQRSLSAALLRGQIVYWLGLISYSLYLVHQPMDMYLQSRVVTFLIKLNVPHAYTAGAVTMLVPILATSAMCYYGIERPGRAFSRRLFAIRRSSSSRPTDFEFGAS